MEKHILENYISQGLSTREISKILNRTHTSVYHWIKKFNLKSLLENAKKKERRAITSYSTKMCPKCKLQKNVLTCYYINKNKIFAWCKECADEIAYQKQIERKKQCVAYKGGKCFICGYNKYIGSLDFHHIDPKEKHFNISKVNSYCFDVIKIELDKCVCLCKNCHCEVHNGIAKLEIEGESSKMESNHCQSLIKAPLDLPAIGC